MNKSAVLDTHVLADVAPTSERARPVGGLRFDYTMALLGCWLVGGFFLDGWAHHHIASLESFFTPWHAVMYSGFAVNALYVLSIWARHHTPGASWRAALPAGYDLSLAGVVIFAFAGIGDMTWHLIFGIERSLDALFSPTHLLLVLGGVLIIGGPLRAALRRSDAPRGWLASLPMVVSLTLVFSVITFITQFAHPFIYPAASSNYYLYALGSSDPDVVKLAGASSILLQGALLTGFVLFVTRRLRLPFGALTLVFTVNAALLTVQSGFFFEFIATAAAAGLLADGMLLVLKPSMARPVAMRIVAFAMPCAYYLLYFVTIMLADGGTWWTVHVWTGCSVMAGIAGVGLSYLVAPGGSEPATGA